MSTNTIGNNDASIMMMEQHLNSPSSGLSVQGNCLTTSAIDPAKRYTRISISHEGKNISLYCQEDQIAQIATIAQKALTSNSLANAGHNSKIRLLRTVSEMSNPSALSSSMKTAQKFVRHVSSSFQNFCRRTSSSSTPVQRETPGFNDSGIDTTSSPNQFQEILDGFDASFKHSNQQIDTLRFNLFNFTQSSVKDHDLESCLDFMHQLATQQSILENHIKDLKKDLALFSKNYTQEFEKNNQAAFKDLDDDTAVIVGKNIADLKTTKDAILTKLHRAEASLTKLNEEASILQSLIEPSITTLQSIPSDNAANTLFDWVDGKLTAQARPTFLTNMMNLLTRTPSKSLVYVTTRQNIELDPQIICSPGDTKTTWSKPIQRDYGILCTQESAPNIQKLVNFLNTERTPFSTEEQQLRAQIHRLSVPQ